MSKDETIFRQQAPTIKVDDVKKWFEELRSASSLTTPSDSLLILSNVIPTWRNAVSDFSQLGREFVTVPLNQGISSERADTKLLITRDSTNNFMGAFIVYVADIDYHISTNGNYQVNNFKGNVIYLDLSGRFLFGYKIINGQVTGEVIATRTDGRGNNMVQIRTCETQTVSYCAWAVDPNQVFRFNIGSGCDIEFTITSTDCPPASVVPNYGGGVASGFSLSGGGSWGDNQPLTLFTAGQMKTLALKYINNGLEDIWLDYLNNNQALLQATEAFLNVRSGFTSQNKVMLSSLILSSTDAAIDYLLLLVSDNQYYNAHKNAGFPEIASDAWVNTTWKSLIVEEGISNLNNAERTLAKNHPREFISYAARSKEAINEAAAFSLRKFGAPNREDGNDRNRLNAFQHSYWNALLTISLGQARAKIWTDAHESGLPDNPDMNFATQMDFWNNEQGRQIGQTWLNSPQGLGVTLSTLVENWLDNGMMKHVCFDILDRSRPIGFQFTNQRLMFTNQICR